MITAKNFWFWFGGIWFAVGSVFLAVGIIVGIDRSNVETRFAAGGRDAEGIVLSKEISSSNDNSPGYRVAFRFDTFDDRTIRGSAELTAEAWDALAERGPILVTYLPDRPATFRVPGQKDDGAMLTLAFGLMGAGFAGVGGFLLLSAFRKRNREIALELHGTLVSATVLDVAPGNLRINGIPQWKLKYRFSDSRGGRHDGSCSLSPDEAQAWKPGQAGRVRYDSRNPRSHAWVGRG